MITDTHTNNNHHARDNNTDVDPSERRIAIYFAGRIKTYEDQLKQLQSMISHYRMDVFCSINGECDDYHRNFMNDLHVKGSFFEDHVTVYRSEWKDIFHRLPTQSDRDAYKLSSSLYHNKKAMELIENHQVKNNFVYDIVLKYRADIISQDIIRLLGEISIGTVYIPDCYGWDFYDQPGINDHIAYGSFDVMKVYSDVFSNVEDYCRNGRGYHPESLLLHHLRTKNIKIERFPFEYTHNTNRHEPGEYG